VRATVDATDGTTHLYRAASDDNDPILDLWDSILPGLVDATGDIPAAVSAHLRYPKDLFVVQSTLLGRYHVDTAEALFNGSQQWTISPAAPSTVDDQSVTPAAPVFTFTIDDSGSTVWSMVRTYNPGAASNPNSARDELSAIITADHDHPDRLTLTTLTPADGGGLSSPRVAQSAILADPELARSITLLNANGSKVQFGPMTPAVLDGGLVWARSLIVTGSGAAAAPRLQSVAAVSSGVVGSGPTTVDAVDAAIRARR
jgi:uncharacterized membrane protein (UPF0182 family)